MNTIKHVGVVTLVGVLTLGPPLTVEQDTTGKLNISIGASSGQTVVESWSCDGNLLSSDQGAYRTGSAMVEFETAGGFRLSGFGGGVWADALFSEQNGPFGGGLVAYEGGGFGLGVGLTALSYPVFSDTDGTVLPSIYLRGGRRDKFHFRSDVLAPSSLFGVTGLMRVGVGVPFGRSRLFTGAGYGRPLGEPRLAGPFAELDLAAGNRLGILLAGSLFPGEKHNDWSIGAGLRFRLR